MKILVARIIGNDLEPRHKKGAQLDALKYIVRNEEVPAGVDRIFVLNRLQDPKMRDEIVAYLRSTDQPYRSISSSFPSPCGDDIELNYARNSIITQGKEGFYHWTFPLDGRCYIPDQAYLEMKAQCAAYAERHYAFMPQHRIKSYTDVGLDLREDRHAFSEKSPSGAIIRNEYALGFSIHATAIFNENLKYGCVDKAEMLMVAGIPGPWINWTAAEHVAGSPVRLEVHDDEFQSTHPAQYSGWTLVLPSGNPQADASQEARLLARRQALEGFAEKCSE